MRSNHAKLTALVIAGVAATAASFAVAQAKNGAKAPDEPNPEQLIEMLKKSAQEENERQAAQDAMNMDPAAIADMIKMAGKPGPEHQFLDKLVGKWDVEAKFFMEPGADPEVSTGTSHTREGLNGLCVITEADMNFNFMGQSIPMKGVGVVGYNRATGEYESMWMDTIDPYMLVQKGSMQNGKLTLEGSGTSQMGGESKMRNVYVFDNDGNYTMEFYQPNPADPSGDWAKVGVIEYTRK